MRVTSHRGSPRVLGSHLSSASAEEADGGVIGSDCRVDSEGRQAPPRSLATRHTAPLPAQLPARPRASPRLVPRGQDGVAAGLPRLVEVVLVVLLRFPEREVSRRHEVNQHARRRGVDDRDGGRRLLARRKAPRVGEHVRRGVRLQVCASLKLCSP